MIYNNNIKSHVPNIDILFHTFHSLILVYMYIRSVQIKLVNSIDVSIINSSSSNYKSIYMNIMNLANLFNNLNLANLCETLNIDYYEVTIDFNITKRIEFNLFYYELYS